MDIPLLKHLKHLFPDSSNRTLKIWLEAGRIEVDGKIVSKPNAIVSPSSAVNLLKKKKMLENDVEILYEDADIIVVNKPKGLLSVTTDKKDAFSLHQVIKNYKNKEKITPVHRLDRDVSGVMVFPLNEKSYQGLKNQFIEHSIYREYRLLVEGKMQKGQGTWKSFLFEDANYYVHSSPSPSEGAQYGITHFEVLKATQNRTFVKCVLETGRKNQIRAHCRAAGFPIVGDKKYGASLKGPIALHAYVLHFTHPTKKIKLKFTSDLPSIFNSFKIKL